MSYYLSALMTRFINMFSSLPKADASVDGQLKTSFVSSIPLNGVPGPENDFGLDLGKTGF
ncbi:MAG: hypothetical protein V4713_12205 [Pseudomonadota bacterium]